MKRLWEAAENGLDAVFGIVILIAAMAAFVLALHLVNKETAFFAIVVSAAMLSAAIYFKKQPNVYNLALGHPDSVEIMELLRKVLEKGK